MRSPQWGLRQDLRAKAEGKVRTRKVTKAEEDVAGCGIRWHKQGWRPPQKPRLPPPPDMHVLVGEKDEIPLLIQPFPQESSQDLFQE